MRLLTFLLGTGLLAAAAGAIYLAATPPPPTAGLIAQQSAVDFGDIAQAEVRTAQFHLTNYYPEPVDVLDILTGCSCTKAELSTKRIASGEQLTVEVNWSVGVRRGKLADTVRILYQTADHHQYMVELTVGATVTPDIHVSPDELRFDASTPSMAVVRFSPGLQPSFVLKQASASQAAFTARLDAAKNEVTVTFDPEKWIDIGVEPWLSVGTDSSRQPNVGIPLRVARGRPEVMPAVGQ